MIYQDFFIQFNEKFKNNLIDMKETPQASINDFIEDFITSYEARIQKIETIFSTSEAVTESSHVLLKDFQNSLNDLREERTCLNSELRENLAKNGSLRKNDYDKMMEDIFFLLDEKEKEAENQFCQYIEDQKAMARFLRKGILDLKDTESKECKEKIKTFKQELEHILQVQKERKDLVEKKLLDFQTIHNNITKSFKMLLEKGVQVFCKDIKNVKKNVLKEKEIV